MNSSGRNISSHFAGVFELDAACYQPDGERADHGALPITIYVRLQALPPNHRKVVEFITQTLRYASSCEP